MANGVKGEVKLSKVRKLYEQVTNWFCQLGKLRGILGEGGMRGGRGRVTVFRMCIVVAGIHAFRGRVL